MSNEPISESEKHGFNDGDRLFVENFLAERRKQILRKIDVRLVIPLSCISVLLSIDRPNMGYSKIDGLLEDLNMTEIQFSICLAVMFIPYILMKVPSNYILFKVKQPSRYIGTLVVGWGTVMVFTGLVKNYGGLVTVRLALGAFQSGYISGSIFLLSRWYLPNEIQTRLAVIFTGTALSGALSGLLSFGIGNMGGVAGYRGWRWIFILEGIFTVLVGALCFFCLPNSPASSNSWLMQEDIRYLELRQRVDPSRRESALGPRKNRAVDWKLFRSVFSDWQIYLLGVTYWGCTIPNNALRFAMPQIIRDMGYTSSKVSLMTILPYVLGAAASLSLSIQADKRMWRMPFVLGPLALTVISFSILMSFAGDINKVAPSYVAIIFSCIGMFPIPPCVNAWTVNNTAGPAKRALSSGMMGVMAGTGAMIGGFIYRAQESPKYPSGYGTSLGVAFSGMAACILLESQYVRINKKRDAVPEEEVRAKYTPQQLEDMGDRSLLFRYSL